MDKKKVEWLPHLTNTIVADIPGWELDAYAVALEGWRRGLTLKWHIKDSEKFSEMKTWSVEKPGKLFSLSNENRTHYFFRTRGDKVSNEAVEICSDKNETKRVLSENGVSVPKGEVFHVDTDVNNIDQYISTSLNYPVVVKPLDGSYGRGVVTNIQGKNELARAIKLLRVESHSNDIIVEQYIRGEDYRVYIVEDKVIGAIKRTVAHVKGDGVSTVQELIENKNQYRKTNPRLISCQIKTTPETIDLLEKVGYSLKSVPKKDEIVILSSKNNISIGGDSEDVLDELSQAIKDTCIKALTSIPNLPHGAVDVMVRNGEGFVLEINPTSQIGSLIFPMKGKARDIPAAIMDYYFPETKNIQTQKERVYFDFMDVIEPLVTRTSTITTVSPVPMGELFGKRYILSGDVLRPDYHRGLRKQAFERNLHGFVKSLIDGNLEVVVVGTERELVEDFKNALTDDPERSDVHEIKEEVWEKPTKIGFEVKADMKTQMEQLKNMSEELQALHKELHVTEKIYKRHTRRLSWQITFPFRKLADVFKFFSRISGR